VRVLFLSPYVPSPIRIRPYSWIRALASLGHDIHLVALRPPEDAWASDGELRQLCRTVEVIPLSRQRTLLNGALTLPTRKPLQLAYSHCPRAERHVARLLERERFDIVHVEHLRGVALASGVRGVPSVWDAVDSISALFAETMQFAPGRSARSIARLDIARTRRFEAKAPFLFDRTLVTSRADADAFVRLAGNEAQTRLDVLPNGVDTDHFRPEASADGDAVVFTGKLSYHANAAAVLRLVRRIMPLVWARRPALPVIIAGKDPPQSIRELSGDPRVTVTGFVADLRPVFAQAALAACPLVYGAGIQNKVLEAMACGVPVVTTPAAASALAAVPGRDLLVGDSDDQFAEAMSRFLDDSKSRRDVGLSGRAYVERQHQWRRLAERLTDVYLHARNGTSPRGTAPRFREHVVQG
jgi:polysaccharide biosynthesis protein PslH